MKQKAVLNNWYLGTDNRLRGISYGHPTVPNGEPIITSYVIKFSEEDKLAETQNTEYYLGAQRTALIFELKKNEVKL